MRGQRALFEDYNNKNLVAIPKREGVGRNKQLHAARNKRLLYRYYYYTRILNKSYQYSIEQLSREFDLSAYRVIISINDNNSQLKKIIQEERPHIGQLAEMFPWFVW